jgi:CheY-like chemotaxis protein
LAQFNHDAIVRNLSVDCAEYFTGYPDSLLRINQLKSDVAAGANRDETDTARAIVMNDNLYASSRARPVLLFSDDNPADIYLFEKALVHMRFAAQMRVVPDNSDIVRWLTGEVPYNDRELFPVPHAIIADLNTAKLPGYDLIRWVRSNMSYRDLPIIIHTGSTFPGDRASCLELGATDFVVKDPTCQNLFESIARILGKKPRA